VAKQMKTGPYCQRRNCSPLSVLFSTDYVDMSHGVPPLGASNKGGVEKAIFEQNISKMVGDTSKVTIRLKSCVLCAFDWHQDR